ncbi:protein translocase subunit [Savitreella phatthalungensis]
MVFGFGGTKSTVTSSPVPPGGQELLGSGRVQQLKQQIRQEMSVAHAQELVKQMTDECFRRCVQVPAGTLTAAQQSCASECMSLYTQAWAVVQRSYIERVQEERMG